MAWKRTSGRRSTRKMTRPVIQVSTYDRPEATFSDIPVDGGGYCPPGCWYPGCWPYSPGCWPQPWPAWPPPGGGGGGGVEAGPGLQVPPWGGGGGGVPGDSQRGASCGPGVGSGGYPWGGWST